MKTRIIIDSSTDLGSDVEEKCRVVPLTLRFGEEEYVDGVTIDHKTFYEKLAGCDILPTTSQANSLLMKEIEKTGGMDLSKPVLLGYTGVSDEQLKAYLEDSSELWKELGTAPNYAPIGSVIGTRVGPGAVAVAFFRK